MNEHKRKRDLSLKTNVAGNNENLTLESNVPTTRSCSKITPTKTKHLHNPSLPRAPHPCADQETRSESFRMESSDSDDGLSFDLHEIQTLSLPNERKNLEKSVASRLDLLDSMRKQRESLEQQKEGILELGKEPKESGKETLTKKEENTEEEIPVQSFFGRKVDQEEADRRCELQYFVDRDGDEWLSDFPFFFGSGRCMVPTHVQHDLVASGFLHEILISSTKQIPHSMFDWLVNLICFCENQHVPIAAFRTIASVLTNTKDFTLADPDPIFSVPEKQLNTNSSWILSYDQFQDNLLILGANSEKFPSKSSPTKPSTNGTYSNSSFLSNISSSANPKPSSSTYAYSPYSFNFSFPSSSNLISLHQRPNYFLQNIELLIHLIGILVISQNSHYENTAELIYFFETCTMLLLDPTSSHISPSIVFALFRLLHAFPTFNENESLSLSIRLLSSEVSSHYSFWPRIALSIPTVSRRSRYFRYSFSFCALNSIVRNHLPNHLFQESPPICKGPNNINSLLLKFKNRKISHSFEKKMKQLQEKEMNREEEEDNNNNNNNIISNNEDTHHYQDDPTLSNSRFLTVIELADICLEKKLLFPAKRAPNEHSSSSGSVPTSVLNDFKTIKETCDLLKRMFTDNVDHPEEAKIRLKLGRLSLLLEILIGYHHKRTTPFAVFQPVLKQKKINSWS